MGMVGLAGRLPDLMHGVNKWITALEESAAEATLALGDIKALLMHVASKHTTDEIFHRAGLPQVATGNTTDHVEFGGHHNQVWAELKAHYREKDGSIQVGGRDTERQRVSL